MSSSIGVWTNWKHGSKQAADFQVADAKLDADKSGLSEGIQGAEAGAAEAPITVEAGAAAGAAADAAADADATASSPITVDALIAAVGDTRETFDMMFTFMQFFLFKASSIASLAKDTLPSPWRPRPPIPHHP